MSSLLSPSTTWRTRRSSRLLRRLMRRYFFWFSWAICFRKIPANGYVSQTPWEFYTNRYTAELHAVSRKALVERLTKKFFILWNSVNMYLQANNEICDDEEDDMLEEVDDMDGKTAGDICAVTRAFDGLFSFYPSYVCANNLLQPLLHPITCWNWLE